MDGNRRWARAKGLPTLEGHLQGYQNFHDIGLYLLKDKKIPFVSAYVFSLENWTRTEAEVGYLMKLVLRALKEFLEEFHREGVRIVVIGQRDRLALAVLKAINKAETETKDNRSGTLALCFNYGGQEEIVQATKKLIEQKIDAKSVTVEKFTEQLYHPEVPPLDLVIRTSGEQRLSGFMLWRASYAELYFVKKHWPDFSKTDVDEALAEYANRQRRYGR